MPANATITGEIALAVGSQRHLYDVPEEVAYFNTANMSPLLRAARAAGEQALQRPAKPWEINASDWFTDVECLRGVFAALVHGDVDGAALIPATSYGLAIAARNLRAKPGDRVVVLAEEYPSSYYTWRRFCERTGPQLVVVTREAGQPWTDAVPSRIDEQTSVVIVPNVHWTNGHSSISTLSRLLHMESGRLLWSTRASRWAHSR